MIDYNLRYITDNFLYKIWQDFYYSDIDETIQLEQWLPNFLKKSAKNKVFKFGIVRRWYVKRRHISLHEIKIIKTKLKNLSLEDLELLLLISNKLPNRVSIYSTVIKTVLNGINSPIFIGTSSAVVQYFILRLLDSGNTSNQIINLLVNIVLIFLYILVLVGLIKFMTGYQFTNTRKQTVNQIFPQLIQKVIEEKKNNG